MPGAASALARRMPAAAGAVLCGALLLRALWSGVTFPESNAVILLLLAAPLAALLLAAALDPRGEWRLDGRDLCLLGYFLAVLALAAASPRRWLARDFLHQTAACTAAWFLAARLRSEEGPRRAVIAGLVSAAFIVSLFGLYQRFRGLEETRLLLDRIGGGAAMGAALASRVQSRAVFSTFFFPNALAGYLIVVIPLAAMLPFCRRAEARPVAVGACLIALAVTPAATAVFSDLAARPLLPLLLWAGLAAMLACVARARRRLPLAAALAPLALAPLWALALTASEGAWAAGLLAAIAGLLLAAGRRRAAAALLVAAGLAAAAAFVAGALPGDLGESMGARLGYWRAAASIWRRNPLLGAGPGSFVVEYARVRSPTSEEGRLAHSAYLCLAAETGAVGLAAFLLFWGAVVRRLSAAAAGREPLAVAACIASLAFLIHGAVDVGLNDPSITLAAWVIAGLGAPAAGRTRRAGRAACLAAAAAVAAAAAACVAPHAAAEWRCIRAARLERAGMPERAAEEIRRAIATEPGNPVYWSRLGGLEGRRGRDDLALDALARAAAAGDGVPSHHLRHAVALRRLGGGADAAAELARAVAGSPADADMRLLLAFWLESDGRRDEALVQYRAGLELIRAARAVPRRIRSHGPEEYARLEALVAGRILELEETGRGGTNPAGERR
ncbi:MAG: O-antigen ligase family protein [bacterium]|nr:O-antigen ligase family protein [bacterium]